MSTTPAAQMLAVVGGVMAAFGTVADVTVLDYTVAGRSVTGDAVLVGEQVGAVKIPPETVGSPYGLEITVAFRILSTSGSSVPADPVQRTSDILDGFVAAMESDPTFGGACSHAVLGPEMVLTPDSDDEGTTAELQGTVVARKPNGP